MSEDTFTANWSGLSCLLEILSRRLLFRLVSSDTCHSAPCFHFKDPVVRNRRLAHDSLPQFTSVSDSVKGSAWPHKGWRIIEKHMTTYEKRGAWCQQGLYSFSLDNISPSLLLWNLWLQLPRQSQISTSHVRTIFQAFILLMLLMHVPLSWWMSGSSITLKWQLLQAAFTSAGPEKFEDVGSNAKWQERAFLVGVTSVAEQKASGYTLTESLNELERLANSAGLQVRFSVNDILFLNSDLHSRRMEECCFCVVASGSSSNRSAKW